MKELPLSVYIADAKTILNQIINHPNLPPSVIEILLKNAHYEAMLKADRELADDYKQYIDDQKTKDKKES